MTPARTPPTIDSLDDAFKDYADKKEKAAKDAKEANAKERETAKEEDRDPDLIKVPKSLALLSPSRSARRERDA